MPKITTRKLAFTLSVLATGIGIAVLLAAQAPTIAIGVLKSVALLGKQPGGYYLLPTNQLLRPWGEPTMIRGRPVDLALDSRGRIMAMLNSRNVVLLDASTGAQIAEVKTGTTSYSGIAFRPDDREIWASEVTRSGPDAIVIIPLSEIGQPGPPSRLELTGHPVPVGIAFSADGATAYVAFSRGNSVGVFDTATRRLLRQIPVGMAPFAVKLSRRLEKLFVSNRAGRHPSPSDTVAPSAGSDVPGDPVTGSTISGTLSVVDLRNDAVREVPVGLAPSALALDSSEKMLAVANSHSDSISLIDTATLSRAEIKLPGWPEEIGLGVQPSALAFTRDGRTLYVGCGGANAVGALSIEARGVRITGAIPTGWFPSAVALTPDGSLRVLTIKGVGNTLDPKSGAFNSRQYEGSLLRIPAPGGALLEAGDRELRALNAPRFDDAGGPADLASLGIRHVFLIVKENRTYDQVFGDMEKGNNDPKLVMYGREITPNHHALAEKFVQLDNFYATSAISFDGHQWLMQAFVSDYVERAFAAAPRGYAWDMSDALTISPTGFFWQHGPRPPAVRIFGEFCAPVRWTADGKAVSLVGNFLPWREYLRLLKEGGWQQQVGSKCLVPALAQLASRAYPAPSMNIPDQLRAEAFLAELAEHEKAGDMPNISILDLTSDHTVGKDPGSPTPRAMVADNDLALGRIVEGISRSRFWPNSLILVVEDDAQDGLDHVDGHRTVALAIGPHIRRGALDSNHYTQLSMVKTIQEIFRIAPKTAYLKTARPMKSVFMPRPVFDGYTCLPARVPIDELNPPEQALKGRELWAARRSRRINWNEVDDVPSDVLNRIQWWEAKGYGVPYPNLRHRGK